MSVSFSEKWVVGWVGACLVYTSWVSSVGAAWLSLPMAWIAGGALAALFLSPFVDVSPSEDRRSAFIRLVLSLVKDPVFWAGGVLVLVCFVQWRNAWWPSIPDTTEEPEWFTRSAPFAMLPSAVNALDGRLMLFNFLNAIVVALSIRHGIQSRAGVRRLYLLTLVNAVALSIFGILQYFSSTNSLYWLWPRKRHFFASFVYENHAGQFFYLMFALAIGYVAYLVCRRRIHLNRRNVVRLIVLLSLIFLSAVFSLSRTGIVFVCGLFVAGSIYVGRSLPSSISLVNRAYLFAGLTAVCITGLVLVSGTVGEDIHDDFARRRPGATLIEQAYNARVWQWQTAIQMWKAHPWLGVGNEGFRYYLPYYVPAAQLEQLDKDHAGQVHNDLIQFLSELGLVGFVPLAVFFAALITPLVRRWPKQREIVLFPAAGAALILIHSLFDLPFRCPAVLAAWATVVAGSGKYAELLDAHSSTEEEIR
jgi:O-antigen ligase